MTKRKERRKKKKKKFFSTFFSSKLPCSAGSQIPTEIPSER